MAYNTAIFIDVENVPGQPLKGILDQLINTGKVGQIAVQRAYAHWNDQPTKTKDEVFELGIDPIEVWSYEKDAADVQLAMDATEVALSLREIEVFVVVSGDGRFATLAKKLHDHNKLVVGCANEQAASRLFKDACDLFLPINLSNGKNNGKQDPEAVAPGHPAENIKREISPGEQISKAREILNLLSDNPDYGQGLTDGDGLPLASVEELLRNQIKLDTSKKRWLVKLLLSACRDAKVCLAKSPARGEHRVFAKDRVPKDYQIVDACRTQTKLVPGCLSQLTASPAKETR